MLLRSSGCCPMLRAPGWQNDYMSSLIGSLWSPRTKCYLNLWLSFSIDMDTSSFDWVIWILKVCVCMHVCMCVCIKLRLTCKVWLKVSLLRANYHTFIHSLTPTSIHYKNKLSLCYRWGFPQPSSIRSLPGKANMKSLGLRKWSNWQARLCNQFWAQSCYETTDCSTCL